MNNQREMFEAWADKIIGKEYDIDGKPNYTAISMRSVMWETWQAAIAAQPEVPLGWKLVPIVPTEKMVNEGSCAQSLPGPHYIENHAARECWKYMIEAVPELDK